MLSMTDKTLEIISLTVGDTADGNRLDRVLALARPDISRARFQALIGAGAVSVNGKLTTVTRHKLHAGDQVEVVIPEAAPADLPAQPIPLDIVFEDKDIIVINKPAGLVVHPGAGNHDGTLANALVAHCGASLSGIGGIKRPGIVHRLDKDTSGLLVIAKNDRTHLALSKQFAAHGRDGALERAYKAVVWGTLPRKTGTIATQIDRHRHNRQKMTVVRTGGRSAITHYSVDETFNNSSLLTLSLETGRTHQIRVHMAHIGHPLLGDKVYGPGFRSSARKLSHPARIALENLSRQALHAFRLGFIHPRSRKKMKFESPLPDDLNYLIDMIKNQP